MDSYSAIYSTRVLYDYYSNKIVTYVGCISHTLYFGIGTTLFIHNFVILLWEKNGLSEVISNTERWAWWQLLTVCALHLPPFNSYCSMIFIKQLHHDLLRWFIFDFLNKLAITSPYPLNKVIGTPTRNSVVENAIHSIHQNYQFSWRPTLMCMVTHGARASFTALKPASF